MTPFSSVFYRKILCLFSYHGYFRMNRIEDTLLNPWHKLLRNYSYYKANLVSAIDANLNGSSISAPLSAKQQKEIQQLCAKRLQRMPVQYVLGEWDFQDLTLKMKPPVFIPRPETEA
ncbi:putative HemK methyltransferase family member 1-like protein, partial [Naja naja]